MAFWGDYHTHTVYSHGKGTIEENIAAAVDAGLKEIGITDHGFRHMAYNVRRMDWPYMEREVKNLRLKYPQINIHLGLEANFNSFDGYIDVLPSEVSNMDLIICGYHKVMKFDRARDFFRFWLPNIFYGIFRTTPKKQIRRNTEMYLRALEKYELDILSHPNTGAKIDITEVAKACKHFGTYFELNGKRISMSHQELEAAAATGVEFICNSDAHDPSRVGDFSRGQAAIEAVGIPYTQVANWERLPEFRSKKLKEKLNVHGFL
ncbi:MAG: PHP domain-containing protein [Firmicutes bacterium]|nr:PHP domain-containing protein [Bacillota bacterium]